MRLIDNVKIVPVSPPVSINSAAHDGTTYLLGDYVNTIQYNRATFIAMFGATGATATMVVYQSPGADSTGQHAVSVDFYKITATSAASDTPVQGTAAASVTNAVNYCTVIIEIDVAALEAAYSDHHWISLQCSTAASTIYSAVCILSEPRYLSGVSSPTAIA